MRTKWSKARTSLLHKSAENIMQWSKSSSAFVLVYYLTEQLILILLSNDYFDVYLDEACTSRKRTWTEILMFDVEIMGYHYRGYIGRFWAGNSVIYLSEERRAAKTNCRNRGNLVAWQYVWFNRSSQNRTVDCARLENNIFYYWIWSR